MRVLIACEFSGIVRDAFRARGHDATSCDLLPCESDSSFHVWAQTEDRLFQLIRSEGYDLMIAFPPCTDLAVSGARWFPEKRKSGEQQRSIDFFLALANAPIDRIAIENPIGIMSTHYRKPDQIIQPWQFGHGEIKATCLWLKNLPKLTPTNIVEGRRPRVHHEPPSPERWKNRSRTLPGLAQAMATQWSEDQSK